MLKWILPVLVLLSCTTVSAASDDTLEPLIQSAQRLLADNEPMQAYQSLRPHEQQFAGNSHYDYWFGVAAQRAGEYFEASIALQRVIQRQPMHAGARLELAGVYIQQNRLDSAEQQLNFAEELDPPPRAQEAINSFREVIAARRDDSATDQRLVMLGIDMGYDSNYLNYPDSFDIFANTVFEGIGIFESDDSFYTNLRGNYWQQFSQGQNTFIEVTAGGQSRLNLDSEAQDLNLHSLQSGINLGRTFANEGELRVGIEAGAVWLDNSLYRRHLGTVWRYQQPISETTLVQTSARFRPYLFQNDRYNYNSYQLEGSVVHRLSNLWRVRAMLSTDYEGVGSDANRQGGSMHRQIISTRADRMLPNNQQLQASLNYQHRSYNEEAFAIFNRGEASKRTDHVLQYRLEWIAQPNRHWRFNSFVQYRDQRSTIDFFDLDQILIQGGVTYVF